MMAYDSKKLTIKYQDPEDPDYEWRIEYNQDYTGNCTVSHWNKQYDIATETVSVPCMVFINWIGFKLQQDTIKSIDSMSGADFLKKLAGI